MSTENAIKPTNIDLSRSPICKRPRLDVNSNESSRWYLSKNELILDAVEDSGIGRLDSDIGIEIDVENNLEHDLSIDIDSPYSIQDSKADEISILQASLPEKSLQLLTLNENEHLRVNEPIYINNNGINYFDFLSDEVVLQILQKLQRNDLSNLSLVCKRFSQLTQDETLWTCLDLSNRKLEKGDLGKIISRQVIVLKLTKAQIIYPPILSNVKACYDDFACRLMYLDLTMASVSENTLCILFDKCNQIRKLSLESVRINDSVLKSLSRNKDLEVLNLAMCQGFGITGLQYLLPNCRKIKELSMCWNYLNANSIEYICDNLPSTLERFNFSGGRHNLENRDVENIVKNCPNLQELDLSDCTVITGLAVSAITGLNELNHLSLSRCYQINSRSLLMLKMMKKLANLSIHGMFRGQMKTIKQNLFHIEINKFLFSSVARPTLHFKKNMWDMQINRK